MIKLLRKLTHFHWDPDWQVTGANAYHECRCGARRVRRLSNRTFSPVTPGWPSLVDRHGMPRFDSGWQREVSR